MLQQLEYLVALARERHFGRAAAACNVTQPALSSAISRLERELKVVIVHRSRRFEGFTPEGERILTYAHRMLAAQRDMLADVGRPDGLLAATVRIGAIPTAVSAVTLLTTAFLERHPASRCQVLALSSREIGRQLTDFELDAGLTYLDDETPPGIRRIELYEERYLLLAPLDHPVMTKPAVSWQDAAELRLCALTTDMRNRRIIDHQLALHGVVHQPIIEANSVESIWAHLGSGRLGAVVAHPWVHAFGIPAGLTTRPLPDPTPVPAVGLVVLDRARSSVVTEALLSTAVAAEVAGALSRWTAELPVPGRA